jgi:hypothetical protein
VHGRQPSGLLGSGGLWREWEGSRFGRPESAAGNEEAGDPEAKEKGDGGQRLPKATPAIS